MLRKVWTWLAGSGSEESETGEGSDDGSGNWDSESDDQTDEGGFVPSILDASVLFSHGADAGKIEADRTEEAIEEEAAALDDYHDKK